VVAGVELVRVFDDGEEGVGVVDAEGSQIPRVPRVTNEEPDGQVGGFVSLVPSSFVFSHDDCSEFIVYPSSHFGVIYPAV
jgi:hypothetical protein